MNYWARFEIYMLLMMISSVAQALFIGMLAVQSKRRNELLTRKQEFRRTIECNS